MTRNSVLRFARHYVEMVLVMLAGMFVLGGAMVLIAAGLGASIDEIEQSAPALVLIGMGASMTAPMVSWMHFRGHSRAANGAMALAMILPAAATLVLLAGGAVTNIGTLLEIEHMAMFPAMLIAMLPYRTEYTGGERSSRHAGPVTGSVL